MRLFKQYPTKPDKEVVHSLVALPISFITWHEDVSRTSFEEAQFIDIFYVVDDNIVALDN